MDTSIRPFVATLSCIETIHNKALARIAGGGVDLSHLGVAVGKTCWVLNVDSVVLRMGDNVLEAISVAARVMRSAW
jgi:exosome complex RNA-binding protein Rrp42 (RNase PH superfamily)